MIAAAEVIHQFLLDASLGAQDEWPVYIAFLPDSPDNALAVYDTAGKQDGRLARTGESVEHPGFQIMVRGASYTLAINKALEIAAALDQQSGTLVVVDSETEYVLLNVKRTGAIIPLGIETIGDRRRHLFSINAISTISDIVPVPPDRWVAFILADGSSFVMSDGSPYYVAN